MFFAYKNTNQIYCAYNGNLSDVEKIAVPGTIKVLNRLPVAGDEVLDGDGNIIPDPQKATREKLAALAATDAGVVRGIDDLINLLITKNIITREELPKELTDKIDARETLREDLNK